MLENVNVLMSSFRMENSANGMEERGAGKDIIKPTSVVGR